MNILRRQELQQFLCPQTSQGEATLASRYLRISSGISPKGKRYKLLSAVRPEESLAILTLKQREACRCTSSPDGASSGWYTDVPVNLMVQSASGTPMYQFTWWCKQRVVHGCTSKHLLGNPQKSSYFALASHESLLLSILFFFFTLKYMIGNQCSEKRETLVFLSFFKSKF